MTLVTHEQLDKNSYFSLFLFMGDIPVKSEVDLGVELFLQQRLIYDNLKEDVVDGTA